MTKRFGFTLAEVLITLGIIGVVAAMTIPTLIANTNGAKFRSQFKKTISTLNQAGLMSQAQYDFDYAGTTNTCQQGADMKGNLTLDHPDSDMTFCAILNGTLTGQTYVGTITNIKRQVTNADGTSGSESYELITSATNATGAGTGVLDNEYNDMLAYTLADGSIVAFSPDAAGCELPIGTQMNSTWIEGHKKCLGLIDVNGATLPNKEVTCTEGGTGNSAANTASTAVETPCVVKNNAKNMTDVFPIVFHDATVEPASDAAKYVLTSAK